MVCFAGAALVRYVLGASVVLRDVCPMSQSAGADGGRKKSGHGVGSRLGHPCYALAKVRTRQQWYLSVVDNCKIECATEYEAPSSE